MDSRRVVVVGAGIGGLTAAIALRRAGFEATVHERAAGPSEIGAGISIWGNATRVFDALGVGDAVRAIGEPLALGEMRLASGRLQSRMDMAALDRELGVSSLILHRAELQAALLSALPETAISYSDELVAVSADDAATTAIFRNGRRVEADLVVGADGLGSKAREHVYGGAASDPLRYSGYTCFRGVVDDREFDSIPRGYVSESWGRGTRFGLIRMTRGRLYWFATKNAPRRVEPGGRCRRDEVDALAREYFDPIPRLVAKTSDDAILRHDLLDRPPRRGWSRGRVVLLGDAAHPTTPNVGQGGCLAVEDAWVLARELARGDPIEAALARYEAARFARCAEIVEFSRRLGAVGQWSSPWWCAVRDLVFRLTPASAIARRHRRYVGFDVRS